jgi:hypothetical protein
MICRIESMLQSRTSFMDVPLGRSKLTRKWEGKVGHIIHINFTGQIGIKQFNLSSKNSVTFFFTTLQIFTQWKLRGLGITGSFDGKPAKTLEYSVNICSVELCVHTICFRVSWLEAMRPCSTIVMPPPCITPHTRLTSTKRFTNLKVNLKCLGLYIGAKMQLVSYEFEYLHLDFLGLRDSKGPILMHEAHLVQN